MSVSTDSLPLIWTSSFMLEIFIFTKYTFSTYIVTLNGQKIELDFTISINTIHEVLKSVDQVHELLRSESVYVRFSQLNFKYRKPKVSK